MAPVFTFDTTKSINSYKYPNSPEAIKQLDKAMVAKKIAKPHRDKFVAALQDYSFRTVAQDANQYIRKNMVAKGLAPATEDPNVLQKAFMVAMYGPQKKVLQASFDLSVHLKN